MFIGLHVEWVYCNLSLFPISFDIYGTEGKVKYLLSFYQIYEKKSEFLNNLESFCVKRARDKT